MTTSYNIISNKRESRKNNMLANKAIIKTHGAARHYYHFAKWIIEKTTTRFKTETL